MEKRHELRFSKSKWGLWFCYIKAALQGVYVYVCVCVCVCMCVCAVSEVWGSNAVG